MRRAKPLTPNTDMAAMSIQYISGGLWKNGMPSSSGVSLSPSSISRATPE